MQTMKWAALWQGILAGLTQLTGGLALTGTVDVRIAGLLALFVGSLQSATAGYYAYSTKTTITGPTIVQPTTLARTDVQPQPEVTATAT